MKGAAPPADAETLTDAQLLDAARLRQTWARDALLARHLRPMHRLAYRLVGPAELDDVLQESVFLALRSLRRLPHADALPAWFARVVVNVVRKRARRQRLLSRLGFVDASAIDLEQAIAPNAPPDVVAELKSIYGALERLPPKPRVAFVLRRIERRSLDEIAVIMGASIASVKRWVSAAEALLETHREAGAPPQRISPKDKR